MNCIKKWISNFFSEQAENRAAGLDCQKNNIAVVMFVII